MRSSFTSIAIRTMCSARRCIRGRPPESGGNFRKLTTGMTSKSTGSSFGKRRFCMTVILLSDRSSPPADSTKLRFTYEALNLPDFQHAAEPVKSYLKSLADYRKNTFAELLGFYWRRVHRE